MYKKHIKLNRKTICLMAKETLQLLLYRLRKVIVSHQCIIFGLFFGVLTLKYTIIIYLFPSFSSTCLLWCFRDSNRIFIFRLNERGSLKYVWISKFDIKENEKVKNRIVISVKCGNLSTRKN